MITWLQFRAYLITTLRNAHVSDLLLRDGSSSRTFCSAASNLDRWHCSEDLEDNIRSARAGTYMNGYALLSV